MKRWNDDIGHMNADGIMETEGWMNTGMVGRQKDRGICECRNRERDGEIKKKER